MAGWLDFGTVLDYGTKAWDVASDLGEKAWEWGTKTEVGAGAILGAAGGVMNYLGEQRKLEAAGPSQVEYLKERNLRHDQGMRDYAKTFEPMEKEKVV